jgi:hypothetical protein
LQKEEIEVYTLMWKAQKMFCRFKAWEQKQTQDDFADMCWQAKQQAQFRADPWKFRTEEPFQRQLTAEAAVFGDKDCGLHGGRDG